MLNVESGQVVHFVPGRVRIKIDALKGHPEVAAGIVRQLSAVPGIHEVQASATTGSVVIRYDQEVFDMEALLGEEKARSIVSVNHSPQEPRASGEKVSLAQSIGLFFRDLNRWVGNLTGGYVDLRALIPLLLLGYAIKRIFVDRAWVRVPAYNLLWYSYSLFMSMNRREMQPAMESASTAEEKAEPTPQRRPATRKPSAPRRTPSGRRTRPTRARDTRSQK
ncbi:MAG: hypothetical protein NZT92_13825 [Abditibacteriales bacterium]|nr:hypothetical protein [Abditibacteriales bacterium]MDW8366995.1 hypothetical protein [Abditibacteriales bacterium]